MKSIWKVMLAVCCLGMTIGCGTNPSKNENVKETLPALVVNGTQLMNTEGDTVVLHGVSYGWHQFWPRFYNASSVAYLVNDWGAQVLRASMGVDLDSACYVNKPEFGIECVTKVVDAAIENGVYVIIDWHSHNLRQEEAKEFFTQMATRYKGVPNVIYEVFNEPVEDSWGAGEVILCGGYQDDSCHRTGCRYPRWLSALGPGHPFGSGRSYYRI